MKKLVMTFALVAFLIGGITIEANAQKVKPIKKGQKVENVSTAAERVGVNYDQMLKDFETNVDNYIAEYEKALKAGTFEGSNYKAFKQKADALKTQLEKAMKEKKLSKAQTDLYLRINAKYEQALIRKS